MISLSAHPATNKGNGFGQDVEYQLTEVKISNYKNKFWEQLKHQKNYNWNMEKLSKENRSLVDENNELRANLEKEKRHNQFNTLANLKTANASSVHPQ
jgi:hypothetical protein